ncbi:MAG: hypothetical protein BAJALOKI2v1_190023 [Promethearchaeota archaeon]|nr:MAG: hypothetical protein BAJALOKI2v1_190023 [Candidatus Lokiarchaeota archaeon]
MKNPPITPSRGPPKKVPPLIDNNIKYSAPWGRMGYIEARERNSDKLLWDLKVYDIDYVPGLEKDVQEKYIISLKIEGGYLEVINEADQKFLVNLETKEVKKL